MPHFDRMICVISSGVEDPSLQQFFSGIVWIDKLPNCVEEICFNVSQGKEKKTVSHFPW